MSGKATFILVLAFSGLFLLKGNELIGFSNDSMDNFIKYYTETNTHNIATAGANMAVNQLFFNKYWNIGYSNIPFENGSFTVTVTAYGDDNRKLVSIGSYEGFKDTVTVLLQPKNFAQYGNFYNVMGGVWAATGDTFSGPFHTNDYLNCYGNPVFLGYTTTLKGVKKYNSYSNPVFLGGLETGVSIPLEFDTSSIRKAAYTDGKIFRDTTNKNYITDVKLTFLNDGKVKYQVNINNKGWTTEKTTPLTTLAPNGVIYVEKGNVYVEGTLNGQATIVATKKGTTSAGTVHIANSITYNKNPLVDPTSTDMLGLVGEQKVQVDFNSSRGDINIHASIYSQNDGLVIDKYSSYPAAYHMNLVGGVIGQKVQPTATYQWVGKDLIPTHGYSYIHKYDQRFYKQVPPYFPKTKYYKVISWAE